MLSACRIVTRSLGAGELMDRCRPFGSAAFRDELRDPLAGRELLRFRSVLHRGLETIIEINGHLTHRYPFMEKTT